MIFIGGLPLVSGHVHAKRQAIREVEVQEWKNDSHQSGITDARRGFRFDSLLAS
jgi:predicted transcriptional regulator